MGKVYSSPYYMDETYRGISHKKKNLKLFMWRVKILRIRMERVRVTRGEDKGEPSTE